MKRILLAVLALAMTAVPMAGCSGEDEKSCADACDKLDRCGELGVGAGECRSRCEQDLEEGTVDQGDIDCVMDTGCGNIRERCGLANTCLDACDKLKSCGFIGAGDVSACTASCEDAATQDEIDCVMDKSCGDILDRC